VGSEVDPPLDQLRSLARDVANSTVSQQAETIDQDGRWPDEGCGRSAMRGCSACTSTPPSAGTAGMLALALVTEELGHVCASTALVYGMHCVATKAVAVNATSDQQQRYLGPIAAGEHVTSLALSEPGTGVHFYLPRATFRREDDTIVLNGTKSFVTSGGHADSYVVSVVGEQTEMDPGTFSCVLLDADTPGASWEGDWDGFGMRGNSSRLLQLRDVAVPEHNLVGAEGDENWYLFQVIAPYFIVAMSGTYLGVARSALEAAIEHLKRRTYDHTGQRVGAYDTVAHRLGELWIVVERARQLLHHAARLGDAASPEARQALFACKAEVAEAAVGVTNEAMTLVGGAGYGRNATLGRALRDARASHVMAPSTDLLKIWLGRSLLDLPLL
jgi:isovaleryl-CoA dehydrogenase